MDIFGACGAALVKEQEANVPRVLIVEDNLDISDMLCQVFALDGYKSIVYAAREAWIERAKRLNPAPAFLLLDLSIPSIDEMAFLHGLRADWQAIPPMLIMTTNKAIYETLAPMERVIRKPFHLRDLRCEVQLMFSYARERMLAEIQVIPRVSSSAHSTR